MKLPRFLIIIFVVTTCAIIYVNQQTQILLASYQLQKTQTNYGYLLDRHEELLYNVAEVESPQNLQKILVMQNIDMQRPGRDQIVKIVKIETSPEAVAHRGERRFFGFLTSQAHAQARSLK